MPAAPPPAAGRQQAPRVEKLTIYIGRMVGGIIGGHLPVVLFHVSAFSWLSLICGFVGCIVGVWLGWKLTLWIGE